MAKSLYEAINIQEGMSHWSEAEAKVFSSIKMALVPVPALALPDIQVFLSVCGQKAGLSQVW